MCTLSVYKLDSCADEHPVCVLKEGEHVIGRGELLACNDKRASRSHASIKIVGRHVTITSIHQNPCFFQAATSKTVVILNKDAPAELKEGDKFGIFPDQFWFRVKFNEDSLMNNNQSPLIDIIPSANEPTTLHKRSLDEDSDTSHSKMRKLENNCINGSTSINCSSICNIESEEARVNEVTVLIDSNTHAKEELSSSDDEEEQLNINILRISQIKPNTTNSNDVDEPVLSESPSMNLQQNEMEGQEVIASAEAKICTKEEPSHSNNEEKQLNTNEIVNSTENLNDVDEPDPEEPSASGTATATILRDKCWYGNNCYRKSSHHKREYSHPGDSDYESDPNDARPVCSYGADCYRKNKDHRKDYKHPRANKKMPPKRKRTATKKAQTGTNAESSEDDYDFDDPFLFDGSEDEYAEESWSESDSDDCSSQNEDEDTNSLMKEAKRFVRKNK